MKIVAIRGKNLASLEEEFELDFTSEPLRSAGIFVITGPTGAGKSTILDALCLALFDNVPRLNKAEPVKTEDENQDTITLKDCRNILRKGAAEGYAGVDFMALNGDRYRSQWTVRRSRGKADGSLQNTSIRLENLSASCEEQGTKKELLNRITDLIGLTFDQFTRAVLLAQGDFATFLKAKQQEKAELLEKLTGTEIYSNISMRIYEKTGEAKTALELLEQRMADVKLLTDEVLDSLKQEKETLCKQSEPLKQQTIRIEKNLNWMKQEELLKQEIHQAEHDLRTIQSKIQEATPRYEYMAMLDLSQEIRDRYMDLNSKRKQQTVLNAGLKAKTEEKRHMEEALINAETALKSFKSDVDELENKYTALKPAMAKAKELDMQIQTATEKVAETGKELELLHKQQQAATQNMSTWQTELLKAGQAKEAIEKWYLKHEQYKDIVPRVDLIINLLDIAKTAQKQKESTSAGLESGKALLQSYLNQLKQQEEEAEKLNHLLPTEVLRLREKLEEGEPCPVCGSIHHVHHMLAGQQDRINEKELEAAKKKIADSILKTNENIANTHQNITAFEIHRANFQSQYDSSITDLKRYLPALSGEEKESGLSFLQNELTETARLWNEYRIQLDRSSQLIENRLIRIESEGMHVSKTAEEIVRRTEIGDEQTYALKNLTDERSSLLGGKSVERIEKRYAELKTDYTRKYESQRTQKEKIESEKASVNGTIIQLEKEATANAEQIVQFDSALNDWLNNSELRITTTVLHDLMSKPREWITQEKKWLNEMKDQELVCSTMLKERTVRLTKHRESEHKPDEGIDKESLESGLRELAGKQEESNKRLTEIQIAITTHEQGKKRIKAFESERKTTEGRYDNWAKLNDLLGSANGNKFKTIAQGYTLDVLTDYANTYLADLTKRYRLEKIPNTLALQVIDNDMLGEVRTVHSLSGGESFLISLSLALGLSSLSSNRMNIESLFIDEGFGSLDMDTLTIAMDALGNLQTQGRKIGVISHVEEMKEQITTQIQVIKSANGRSIVKVTG